MKYNPQCSKRTPETLSSVIATSTEKEDSSAHIITGRQIVGKHVYTRDRQSRGISSEFVCFLCPPTVEAVFLDKRVRPTFLQDRLRATGSSGSTAVDAIVAARFETVPPKNKIETRTGEARRKTKSRRAIWRSTTERSCR